MNGCTFYIILRPCGVACINDTRYEVEGVSYIWHIRLVEPTCRHCAKGWYGLGRILYAASTFGHLRSFHIPYLRELMRLGNEVVALAAGDPSGMPEGVEAIEAPFTKSMTSPRNLAVVRQVAGLLRARRFDLVVTHTSLAAFFVRLGVMGTGGKRPRIVNTVHGYLFDEMTPLPKRCVMLGAEKLTAGVTDRIVTMNRQDTQIARRHRLCRDGVVQVDGMGVDLAGCHVAGEAERGEARWALGIPDDAFVLLYAAEFSRRKNQRALIEALGELPDDVVLALPGRGDELEACRERARELGVEERVLLPGFVRGLAPWRSAADACVSTSRSEGLPFHVIEAMACGLPVVLSQVKGHEDLVNEGVTGLLYPFGDQPALRVCVDRLRADRAEAHRMGEAARRGAQRFRLEVVMPQVLAALLGE